MNKSKPRMLDLYCGGGGATKGYQRAGWYVIGVDSKPQPHYCGDEFIEADALDWGVTWSGNFHAVHASPPCQAFSEAGKLSRHAIQHPDLIAPTRELLTARGLPWVIKNVPGAPLRIDLELCGSMFGLRIRRHRWFEASFPLPSQPQPCDHRNLYDPWHGPGRTADKFREAMGIDWLPIAGGRDKPGSVDLAIPPAYTELIGGALIRSI